MHLGWHRWLSVCVVGIAVQACGTIAAQPKEKETGEPAKTQSWTVLEVNGTLTDKDTKDKTAPDCFCKTYPFKMEKGTAYRIDLKSTQFDAFLRLEDPDGKQVAEDDDSGGDLNARIPFKASVSGEYKIVASTFKPRQTGKFTLTVVADKPGAKVVAGPPDNVPPATVTKLDGNIPVKVEGHLTGTDPKDSQGKHYKIYSVKLLADTSYRIYMKGAPKLDAYLRLEDAQGKMLAEDELGDPNDSGVQYTPAKTALYRIVATTYKGGMTGNFTLAVSAGEAKKPTPQTPPDKTLTAIPIGTAAKPHVIEGTLAATDPKDDQGKHFKAYSFEAKAGHTYRFAMTGKADGIEAFVRLEDGNGKRVKDEDTFDDKLGVSSLRYTAAKTGRYRVIASTFKAGVTGKFTLSAREEDGTATPGKVARAAKVQALPALQKTTLAEVAGRLTAEDGVDKEGKFYKVYTFQAQPDRLYRIQMYGRTFDAQLQLQDADGKLVKQEDSFDGRYSQLVIPPGKGGAFHIIAGAAVANQVGTFSLTITEIQPRPAPAPQAIAFNQLSKISGKLTAEDGIDKQGKFYKTYTIKAQADLAYRCEMSGQGFDAFLRLEDDQGNLIKKEDFGDVKLSRLDFKARKGTTYRLIATSFDPGQTGEFTLIIAERDKSTAAAPKAIKFAQGKATEQAALVAADDTLPGGKHFRAYTFEAEAGKAYRIELHSKAFDAHLYLKDADGKMLAENGDNGETFDSRIVYKAAKAGTYHIVATSLDEGKTGPFVLSVAVMETGPVQVGKLLVKDGEATTIKEQLTEKDGLDSRGRHFKAYAFPAKQGKSYRFEMLGEAGLDPLVRIEDETGKVLKEEDTGNTKQSRLVFKAPLDGTFRLVAGTFKAGMTGKFILTAATIEIKEAKALPLKLDNGKATIEDKVSDQDGTDDRGKHYKVYAFKAVAGKVYRVEMTGKGGYDPLVRIDDASSKTVKEEDFGDGKMSRLDFKPAQAGTFKIVATSFKPATSGAFTLVVSETAVKTAQAVPLKLDNGKATTDDALTDQDVADIQGKRLKAYALKAEAGKFYRIEMTGKGGLDPSVRVEDDQGTLVKDEDFGDGKVSRVTFKASRAGAYRIVATTFKAGVTGAFRLTAAQVEIKDAKPLALKLEDGKAVTKAELTADDGRLASGKLYKEFTFAGEAGQHYKIDLHSKAFDAYLVLKDANGKQLAENDDGAPPNLDARIIFKAPKAGTYRIIATSLNGNGTGPFVLTISAPSEFDKLMSSVNELPYAKPEQRKQLVQELQKYFEGLGDKLTEKEADLAVAIANNLEQNDRQLAAAAYGNLGKVLAASTSSRIARDGKMLLGAAKRLNLVGQPMQAKGKAFGGGELDLSKLKGKVVLVDFWASWCGPCKAELPNVRKLYAKYHEQGFEVIGVSLDSSEKALSSFLDKEKLPWKSIWQDDAMALADDYGVFMIPLAVLVGRDGRVISLSARGEELDRLLDEQFRKK